MSVTGYYTGNVAFPICQTLANTNTTKIGATAVNDTLTLASFAICNDNAAQKTCFLYWYDASTTTEQLVWKSVVPADDTEFVSDLPIRLRSGDEIRVKGDNNVHVTLVYVMNFALTRA